MIHVQLTRTLYLLKITQNIGQLGKISKMGLKQIDNITISEKQRNWVTQVKQKEPPTRLTYQHKMLLLELRIKIKKQPHCQN